jgi:hypothetical protein
MSQIDDSVLGLAQRAAYKPQRAKSQHFCTCSPSGASKTAPSHLPTEQKRHMQSLKVQSNISTRCTRKQSVTYPTDSPSAAASVLRLRLPSLSPFPSHSCSNDRKTKASSGGGRKRSSSQESRRSCGGKGSKRKPRMLKTSGGRVRIAC